MEHKMISLKKIFVTVLCFLLAFSLTVPSYAADARLSHGIWADMLFGITDTGMAEVSVDYVANSTSFTNVTIETYIQKRTLGLIWTKVDNGEVNKTWIDTSTAEYGYFVHHLQLEDNGTYRTVFKITFSGTGAEDDVITEKVVAVYE